MVEDIISSRRFAAPRDLVYAAFADPAVLARWWGPVGFSSDFEEFDFRGGGDWRLVMRGPDGAEYRMRKVFEEVVPLERIVLRHIQPGATHDFRMTITFEDEADGTRLTWRIRFDSAEEADRVRAPILAANEENFDRLAAVLPAEAGDGSAIGARPSPPDSAPGS